MLRDELELANELYAHRVKIFDGITTEEQRKAKARDGIRERGIAFQKAKGRTFGEWFLKAYGEAL